jgi:hypothetical protein
VRNLLKTIRGLAPVYALAACLATAGMAQDITGSIGGAVLDPSGAGVPNAKVALTNIDRNLVVRSIKTDATGTYSATFLPIGNYSIQVDAAGFKNETRSGIVLNVADNLKINITLQIGAAAETVEVRAEPVQVDLGSAAAATTITGTQVRDLQLSTRNYEQLVSLMPGVSANTTDDLYIGNSAPAGTAATLPYSIGGNRNSANNWTVDGADNVDRGSNQTLMTFPSVDAIAEFKVERSLYTADTGRAGGAQIAVVTKSGSASFHGSAYEFFRNDALAANNFSNNANKVNFVDESSPATPCTSANFSDCKSKVSPLRWNDFGFTLGGPIYIPNKFNKNKNKDFFFYSQEWRRIITYTTFNPTLPTQAMLQGQFPQPVCIATVAGTCPAGSTITTTIPANLINPQSAAFIKDVIGKLSLSSTNSLAAITSEYFPQRNIYNARQEIGRIDHYVTDNFLIYGRFEIDDIPTTEPGGLFTGAAIPGFATTNTNSPGRSVSIHIQNTISSSLVNDAGFNYSQSAINSTPAGTAQKADNPDFTPPEPFANTQGVIPEVSLTGGSTFVGYGPYNEYNKNFTWFDNLTKVHGRHTFKAGLSINRYNKTENAANQEGNFSFSNAGVQSGTNNFMQSWANFLLGNVASFTMPSTDITPDLWAWQHEAYGQDDFKVSSRLTLYMGVRWSYFGLPSDSHNLLDNFDPATYNRANAPQINPAGGTIIAGTGSNPTTNGIIVGGKGSPFGNTVGNDQYKNFAPRLGMAWDPFGTGTTSVRAGYGIYYDSGLFGTYEQNTFANPPYVQSVSINNGSFSNIASGTQVVSASPLVLHATAIPALVPYVQQWSLDIQRRLPKNVVLDIGYYGSKGTHLLGYVDINEAYPGVALANGLHAANGNTIFTTADDPNINAVRPYLGFNAINTVETAFDSNYHSLQATVRKDFRGLGLFNAAYTWSKVLTDNSSDRSNAPQNSYNWHEGEYGPASFNRTQVLTLNYVYTLPFFKTGHGFKNTALGGWEVSGIATFQTGLPATVTTSSLDAAGLGLLGSSGASARPDMVCNPNSGGSHLFNGVTGPGGPTWFNISCFQPTPQGAIRPGNAGRYTVDGPGYFNWDAALLKNFKLGTERAHLQLRGEAFNVLNWVNPSGFASTNITSSLFGQISSYRAARRIQIAAKFTF